MTYLKVKSPGLCSSVPFRFPVDWNTPADTKDNLTQLDVGYQVYFTQKYSHKETHENTYQPLVWAVHNLINQH